MKIYGKSKVAIGRIISKVYVRKLFRCGVSKTMVPEATSGQRGVLNYHISGLQE